MKNILFGIIDVLMRPFGWLLNERVVLRLSLLKNAFYGAWVRHKFKVAPFLIIIDYPFRVRGGECIELGHSVSLGRHCRLEAITEWRGQKFRPRIVVGEHAVINALCHIGCIDEVRIGKYTTLAERTYVTDHLHGESKYEHMLMPPRHRPLYSKGKVVIGDYVSIGEGCAILPGVTIGDHCIIGTNAVVTKDIPPYSVVGGIPARVLKTITKD